MTDIYFEIPKLDFQIWSIRGRSYAAVPLPLWTQRLPLSVNSQKDVNGVWSINFSLCQVLELSILAIVSARFLFQLQRPLKNNSTCNLLHLLKSPKLSCRSRLISCMFLLNVNRKYKTCSDKVIVNI